MVNSTGALLIKKSIFDRLSKDIQKILKISAKKYCRELIHLAREDNEKAFAILQKEGIIFESPSKNQISSFHQNAGKIYSKSIPELYSKDLFDRVQHILKTHRNYK